MKSVIIIVLLAILSHSMISTNYAESDSDLIIALEKQEEEMAEQTEKFRHGTYSHPVEEFKTQLLNDFSSFLDKLAIYLKIQSENKTEWMTSGMEGLLASVETLLSKIKTMNAKTLVGEMLLNFYYQIISVLKDGFTAVVNELQDKPIGKVVSKEELMNFTQNSVVELRGIMRELDNDEKLKSYKDTLVLSMRILDDLPDVKPFTKTGQQLLKVFKAIFEKIIAYLEYRNDSLKSMYNQGENSN